MWKGCSSWGVLNQWYKNLLPDFWLSPHLPKKRSLRWQKASFSQILWCSQKKKKKKTSSVPTSFLRASSTAEGLGADNHSCLRFLAKNKNAGWCEIKTPDFPKFSVKMPEKILQFFVHIGSTGINVRVKVWIRFRQDWKSMLFKSKNKLIVHTKSKE